MSLLQDLRTQLSTTAGQLPIGLLVSLHTTVTDVQAQLLPELADSDNGHAHQARDALVLLAEELAATLASFTAARCAATGYIASR